MRRIELLAALLLLSWPVATYAADPVPPPPPPPSEPPAANAPSDQELEPEITITTKKNATIYEYRINGQLYMMKVVPAEGPPYYLIDPTGTGQWQRSEFGPTVSPPMWVIKKF
jgi:hypothetical protein